MAIPLEERLRLRRSARFHVQIQIEKIPTDFQTPIDVSVEGRVVQVFRSDGSLALGERVAFSVHVCRDGDDIPEGPAYTPYEQFVGATYIETYLNGDPPACEVPLDEWVPLRTPSDEPRLSLQEPEQQGMSIKKEKHFACIEYLDAHHSFNAESTTINALSRKGHPSQFNLNSQKS